MRNYSISITLGSFAGEALPILLGKSPPTFLKPKAPLPTFLGTSTLLRLRLLVRLGGFQEYMYYTFCKMKEIKDRPKKERVNVHLYDFDFGNFG
jgi:hypothetical protein